MAAAEKEQINESPSIHVMKDPPFGESSAETFLTICDFQFEITVVVVI